jgi:hypothetical protein
VIRRREDGSPKVDPNHELRRDDAGQGSVGT